MNPIWIILNGFQKQEKSKSVILASDQEWSYNKNTGLLLVKDDHITRVLVKADSLTRAAGALASDCLTQGPGMKQNLLCPSKLEAPNDL